MLWDTHMHTRYSGDSEASPDTMVRAAIQKGLGGICFTDHYDYAYPKEPALFLLDFSDYEKEISALREAYSGQISIRWGVELGLQPQLAEHNRSVANAYPFDFIIGSSHVVHGIDPYYPEYYEGRRESAAYLEYFESILENLQVYTDFDVYGHLDYVVRYGPCKDANYSYEEYSEVIDEILRTLIAQGKGIEVNTGGIKYGLLHPHPTEAILARYRELGGEIVTLGADAHKPEHVAHSFEKLPEILRAAGFSHFTVFEGRKPRFLPLG
ncbi:MAG: histidinol-phosphatase HisJ family protein [Muribaculaceae bacterium]|nr:histidinol-phosphatase HisJ family protein [Roseburia sp.]MCM1430566.1 histidinol-phosphatase HisJ family protein [Muribaculaceae bacterium]MCM1492673.1 histidinol-phosphatase HisJ family protein [Muribaculaceae bacterium]